MGTFISRFSCCVLTLFFVGCASINTTPPDVSLVDIQFGDISVFETTLILKTRIRNESPKPITITGVTHEVALNDTRLGKAISKERIHLDPLEAKEVTAKLEVSHLNLAFNLSDLIESPKLDYRLTSTFFLSGFGGRSVTAKKSGILLSERSKRPYQ